MAQAGNAIYVSKGSTLSMTGGKVYADAKRGNYAIRIGGKDAIFTMTGGVAEADSSTTEAYITAIGVSSTGTVTIGGDSVVRGPKALTTTSLTALTVTGGSFTGEVSAPKNSITGGTFTTDVTAYLADEHVKICEKQADGSYTVAKAEFTAVATITDKNGVVTRYAAATEAFSALKDGDTLKLLADIGTAAEPLPYGIVVTDGDVNVNLNAKTLIIGYDAAAAAAAGVPGYAAGVGIVNGGSGLLTVSGNGTLDVSNYTGTDGIAVWARTGSITVKSGTFINKSNEEATVYVGTNDDSSPVLKISGGTYKNIAEGNYKYDESRAPLTFNIYNGKTADALKISAGSFYGNNDPYLGDDQVKGSILATEMTGVRKNDGYYVVANGQTIQLLDANGGAKNFYTDVTKAFAGAADGDTLILLKNTYVSKQLNVTKAVTIDLGGYTLTNTYAPSKDSYSLLTRVAVTMKNGTYKSTKASARGIAACADFTLENATVEAAGLVGLGCSAPDATYTVKNSTVIGNYALANFVNNAKINIESSTITGTGTGIYHNGSNSGLQLTAVDSTITAAATGATNGIYVSGSTDTMAAAGAQQVTLTNCTVSGATAIEVKYTDLTLTDCTVTATVETPSYKQDNNGATTAGFAVVSTDNATGAATPAPKGTITIQGANGSYKGQVGLASLETVKTGYADFKDTTYAVSGGSFTKEVLPEYCAEGFIPTQNEDGTYGVKAGKYVAEVNGKKYETLQGAIEAAAKNSTVKLIANTRENVTISTPYVTLDLNGFTLNGSTGERKPALTVTARVTVKDSNEAQTGTIMREDTAENSGVSSHYVIDIQGSGWLTFESGNVTNNSGNDEGKGASLVRVGDDSVAKYPGLNIKGGTFTQDNFIVIKVDRGDLFLNGGTLNSANSYAIENWHRATIKGGTVNGTAAAWTYSGGLNSDLTISGGTVNGNVLSVNYGNSENRTAKVIISGGTVNGKLGTHIYSNSLTETEDTSKATIGITGGTFTNDPTKYVIEDSAITANADGTFGVAKAYLATVGETSYYTMEEAFKAQTASGEPIVLLRDYTTGSPFNSGSINRTVDLNGHTWTCTGTDANSAAFEINYPDVTLTVKNGKVVSSQLVGLIPSAMGGTMTYNNSGLVFEDVEMSTTATSGIETNGNNTNDTVTLKNSTLNVPNGFGIYFPSSGTLTVENSKITAKTMGVQVCAGSLSINKGSEVTVSGGPVEKIENDGAIQDGAAISIVNRTGYKGLGKIEVTGGTFTAKANSAIKAYDWENNTNTERDFTASEKVAVSGGTFSSAVPKDLCADGFIPTKNADGTYGVKEGKYVASIGDTKYETLQAAVDAATNGQTVTLIADVDLTETLIIKDKTITLDLNGKKLSTSKNANDNTKHYYAIDNYGTFTLRDSSAAQTGEIRARGIENLGSGKMVIESGKIVAIDTNGGAAIWNLADLTIQGGTFVAEHVGASGDQYGPGCVYNNGKLTINGGTFKSANKRTYAIVSKSGAVTITPAEGKTVEISGAHGGLGIDGGTAIINGGSYASDDYYGLYVSNDFETAEVTVTGGTFDGKEYSAFIGSDGSNSVDSKLIIKGGTFNKPIHAQDNTSKGAIQVSSGTFSSAVPKDYCAEFFKPVQNADGKYTVEKVKTNNVKINFGGTGGSQITVGVDGGISIINNHTQEFATGELVSLTATAQDNAKFLFWLDSNGRIVSTNATYQFYVDSDISVTAQFYTPAEGKRYVIFIDMNNYVAGYADVAFGSTVTAPDHLTFANRTFDGWYVDGHTNKYDVGASITVTTGDKDPLYVHAKYTATDAQFTIIVNDEVKTYKYGDRVEVTADADTEGHYFIGWYDDGGILLSSKRTYIFTVTREITVTAKYSETMPSPSSPVVNLYVTDRTPDNNLVIVYEVTWDVPDDYVFATAGLILSTNSDNKDKLLLEKVGKNGIVKVSTTLPNNTPNGKYIYTLTLDADTSESTIYARGYMSFSDSDGNITTIYTEVHESVSKKA